MKGNDPTRCVMYDPERGGQCRNKKHPGDQWCRRHIIEYLKRWESNNGGLLYYLENRHLLPGKTTSQT